MLRIAILTARSRLGIFAGALLAFFASGLLVTAGAMLLQAALLSHPPVERYAGTVAVVTGHQDVGPDHDVILGERARVSTSLVQRLAAVPGVKAAIADVSVPASLGGRSAEIHGWSSAELTPYVLTAGRAPVRPGEVVAGYPVALGAQLELASTEAAKKVTVVGVARPRHGAPTHDSVFLTDAEAQRLAGHPGLADAIGVIAARGLAADSLRAAAGPAVVLTGDARGTAEGADTGEGKTRLIAVAASFGGVALFITMFVVAGTMALATQQREHEIALLRAIGATPGQVRRMISWEAVIIAFAGTVAGIYPGQLLGRWLAQGLVTHGIAPADFAVHAGWLPAVAAVVSGVAVALLAVLSAGRRAARVAPTRALADAAVEPGLLSHGRLIGGLLAIAGAAPLFSVASTTHSAATAAATSELAAIFLVVAVGCLGPVVARVVAWLVAPVLSGISPVSGFLASTNLATATRRFSSASTPIALTVAMSCTLLFSSTTLDHAVTTERQAGVSADLAVSGSDAGLPAAALADVQSTPGVTSAVALTPTTLGPSLGVSDDPIDAQILAGGQGGGFDADVTTGSLADLHGATIALGSHLADGAHARVGERVSVMLGDGTRADATVVAVYDRSLAFGDALLSPELAASHTTSPLLGTILVRSTDRAVVAQRLRLLASRYPGLRVADRPALAAADDADRATNRWLGPLFVVIVFGFTSIAVVNTLTMIAMRRRRELALIRLSGATNRQVRSMARWEAVLVVAIGLGVGLAIAATALLPLSHALNGSLVPYVPLDQLGAILGVSTGLALLALALPTRRALRTRPISAVGLAE